jgi:hypothetical protein
MHIFPFRRFVFALAVGTWLPGCTGLLGDFSVERDSGLTEGGPENSGFYTAETGAEASDDATVAGRDAGRAVDDATVPEAGAEAGAETGAETGSDAGAEAGCEAGLIACAEDCVSPSDPHTCGACDHDCTQLPFVLTTGVDCAGGRCTYACTPGHADCGDAGAGCTTSLASTGNCGGCGVACSAASPVCEQTTGGSSPYACTATCAAGEVNCSATCATLATDPDNCGACGTICSTLHATATCSASNCLVSCAAGYADCDKLASTGCEIDTTSNTNNCGGCGTLCNATHATASCVASKCVVASCASGYADCDALASNGCEVNLTTDVNHCGACGTSCNLAHATAACGPSGCVIASCSAGYADCDGVPSNGCETDITLPANCGGCNTASTPTACAAAAPVCSASTGTCVTGCATNTPTLCAGNKCVDTTRDPNNCGGCNVPCSTNHTSEVCNGSVCAVSSCATGYADCDGLASNGCEVNVTADASNCLGCGNACATRNAAEACTTAGCTIVSCSPGFADCDGLASTGCEINTTSDKGNCNGCGGACPSPAQTCANSACQCPAASPTLCSATNTCVLTTNDNGNCGTCGHACAGGTTCQNGTCTCPTSAPLLCGVQCVNPNTDPTNCGQCTNACAGQCLSGVCQCVTPGGTNLLANGGFDKNVTGWTAFDPNIVLTFAALDAAQCATSGSVLASNQAPNGLNSGFFQCVPVVAGQSYDVGAWIRTPSGGAQGQTFIQLGWFTAANCQGTLTLATQLFASGTFDTWELLSRDNIVAPSGTASAYVYGQIIKNLPDTRPYQTYYDMMYLSQSPGHF